MAESAPKSDGGTAVPSPDKGPGKGLGSRNISFHTLGRTTVNIPRILDGSAPKSGGGTKVPNADKAPASETKSWSSFSFTAVASSIATSTIKSASSAFGTATSKLVTKIGSGVSDTNLESLRSATMNVATSMKLDSVASNLYTLQDNVQGNIKGGFQASIGGLKATAEGFEGISKTIMENIAKKGKALTNAEVLRAQGNDQLQSTIYIIELQILFIVIYFAIAFAITWTWEAGVETTKTLLTSTHNFLGDPNLNNRILNMRDSIGNELHKLSDLDQIRTGIGGISQGLTNTLKEGVHSTLNTIQDSATHIIMRKADGTDGT